MDNTTVFALLQNLIAFRAAHDLTAPQAGAVSQAIHVLQDVVRQIVAADVEALEHSPCQD
jgi:hypothetical protein